MGRRDRPALRPGRIRRGRGRWVRSDDAEYYAAAEDLDADLPLWWVWWSPYRRRFTAIWQGPHTRQRLVPVLEADHPRALRLEAVDAQQAALAPPSLHLKGQPAPPDPWETDGPARPDRLGIL